MRGARYGYLESGRVNPVRSLQHLHLSGAGRWLAWTQMRLEGASACLFLSHFVWCEFVCGLSRKG